MHEQGILFYHFDTFLPRNAYKMFWKYALQRCIALFRNWNSA